MEPNIIAIFGITEWVNYWLGLLLNSLLLYFIIFKTESDIGTYKYLQIAFLLTDAFYATISYVFREKLYTVGYMCCLFQMNIDSRHTICIWACTFSLIIVIVDFNFLYRYWAVSNPHLIELFSTKRFQLLLFSIAAIECASWYSVNFHLMEATPEARASIAPALLKKYGIDAMERSMIITDYWRDGHYNAKPLFALCFCSAILTFGFAFMVYCGVGTVKNLSTSNQNISAKTRKLQYQLFRMLTIQTAIPLCSVHFACASTLVIPVFGIAQEFLGDICSPLLSFFAPLDAFAVILLMSDYRKAARSMLSCGRNSGTPIQSISGQSQLTSLFSRTQ